MKRSRLFAEMHRDFENDPEYLVHGMLLEVVEAICAEMERQKLNRSDLAKRLGVERQYVTEFLNTSTNTTLLTIARFAKALDVDVATLLTGAIETARRVQKAGPAPSRADLEPPAAASWTADKMVEVSARQPEPPLTEAGIASSNQVLARAA